MSVVAETGVSELLAMRAEGPGERRVAQVLLDSALPQLDHLFDYAVPASLAGELRVGHRVRVPFRSQNRHSHGYVIAFAESSDFGGRLQEIAEIVGPVPQLTPDVWRLARAVADRAGGSACDILRLAIPQRMVRVEKQHLAARANREDVPPADETVAPVLVEAPGLIDASVLIDTPVLTEEESGTDGEASGSDMNTELTELLLAGGRVSVLASHGPERLSTGEWVGNWAVRLASAAISVFEAGRSAIVIAPDYRDVEQLRDTFGALGHEELVLVSARQSNAERYKNFLRALDPEPRIILGNRSAVYAPAHRLGAILLWDDGDPMLAEPLSPYVHARDAALVRAEQSGAGLGFFAHARSAEVQRLVDLGYVQTEQLPPRRTRVVHADAAVAPDAFAGRVPEFAARAIRQGLSQGPVLVQVATPGYAPVAVCGGCGDLARCGECSGPIGFRSEGQASCRWCGRPTGNWSCRACGDRELRERGMGSKRTARQFQQQFAGARVLLSDGDHPLERLDSRSALVVATRGAEPIAAGGYRTVVLLDVERLLNLESLRAGEDCMRWWQNAAALAAADGQVVVASGGGPVVRAFVTGRVDEWLRAELRDRQLLRFPPAVRVASVTGGTAELQRALEQLGEMPGVDVLGPTPVPTRRGTASTGSGVEDGSQRAIVRFEYARGAEVAKRLRGALVADAAGASSRVGGRRQGRAGAGSLRLRFDDRAVFDS